MASVEGLRYRPGSMPAADNPSTGRAFDNRFRVQTTRSSYLIILILTVTTLIVTTLIVTTYLPKTNNQFKLSKKTSGPYEFLRLVLTWGPSLCRVKTCRRHTTAPNFTLHGLWPDNRTQKLCYCSDTPYAPLQNKSDINQRDEYWFDYISRPGEQGLWSHEWTKHGTCSEIHFRQAEYFNKAVALTQRYNLRIREEIQRRVVFPATSTEVLNVIKNVTNNKQPEVRCVRRGKPKRQELLNEVVICFNPTGTDLVDCPPKDGHPSCSTKFDMPKTFDLTSIKGS